MLIKHFFLTKHDLKRLLFYVLWLIKNCALKRLALLFTISIIFSFTSFAQTDTCHLRITLLTCSPGSELYSTFGHTAVRVTDAQAATDLVFNYGTFEFAPDFYTKFIRGKLLYSLSVQYFSDFVNDYNFEQRGIIEQELNLTCAEKQKLYEALQINALEENRHYRYDFLFDNCSTRPAVIIAKNTNAPVVLNDILPEDKPTFRNLIHTYLNRAHQYWSKFGIDILLGSKLDKKVNTEEATFLPDYLMTAFDSATVNNQPLVSSKQTILKQPHPINKKSFFRPEIVFSILFVIIALLTFVKNKNAKQFLKIFDFVFFLTLGIAGAIILFMWFGTDHVVTQNNFNLVWALPTHLFAVFTLHKNKSWHLTYFKTIFVISCLFLLSWFILPQQLNFTVLPILLIIILRSWYLGFKRK
jgi:hypothetical protein